MRIKESTDCYRIAGAVRRNKRSKTGQGLANMAVHVDAETFLEDGDFRTNVSVDETATVKERNL